MTSKGAAIHQVHGASVAAAAVCSEKSQPPVTHGELPGGIHSCPMFATQRCINEQIQQSPVAIAQREKLEHFRHGSTPLANQQKSQPPVQPSLVAPALRPLQSQTSATVQQVAWHEARNLLPAFNLGNGTGGTTQINVSGYNFTGPQYSIGEQAGDDKVKVIANIAKQIAQITHPASAQFLSRNELESTLKIPATIPLAGLVGAMVNPEHRNIYTSRIDPHIIRVPGKTKDGEKIALHYQFGKDSYGYIVKIEQEGKTYLMHEERGQKALLERQLPKLKKNNFDDPIMDRFASAHDTDNSEERIGDVATKSTTGDDLRLYSKNKNQSQDGNLEKLGKKSKRLDAVTKVGGEGARWNCVRKHARDGKLTDGSRFYCTDPNGHKGLIGISFEKLWSVWADWFKMKFGIDDSTVKAKLIEKNEENDELVKILLKQKLTDADYALDG